MDLSQWFHWTDMLIKPEVKEQVLFQAGVISLCPAVALKEHKEQSSSS